MGRLYQIIVSASSHHVYTHYTIRGSKKGDHQIDKPPFVAELTVNPRGVLGAWWRKPPSVNGPNTTPERHGTRPSHFAMTLSLMTTSFRGGKLHVLSFKWSERGADWRVVDGDTGLLLRVEYGDDRDEDECDDLSGIVPLAVSSLQSFMDVDCT